MEQANMAKIICLACGATYDTTQRDGSIYSHACPVDKVTTPAVFDATGTKLITPEVRTPIANPRNENVRPDLVYIEGKPKIVARDPNDATRQLVTDATSFIIAEGAGRALYDDVSKTAGAPIVGPTIPGK
jgi:hypothetical protein